jgi:prophage antirepressor-like protein
MDIIQAFVDNDATAEINIKGTYDDPLFQANQISKLLNIKNIHTTIKDFDEDEKVIHTMDTLGGDQNITFLTEIGLYKLLGMSKKPLAKKFNKWVFNVIKEIRIKGKYELEGKLKDAVEQNKKQSELIRHNTIVERYKKIGGVYIGKIKEIDDYMVIKIGSTEDTERRGKDLKKYFGTYNFIEYFTANQYKTFEKSLKDYPIIKQYLYHSDDRTADNIYCSTEYDTYKTETYCIPKEFYSTLVSIIKRKQKDYQGLSEEHVFELEKQKNEIKLIEQQKEAELIKLQQLQIQNNIPITITKEVQVIVNDDKKITLARGHKIQKYTPDGKLVKTFKGLCVVVREEPRASESGIRKAISNKTLYYDHRWLYLDRNKPDNTVQELGKTKEIIKQNLEFIAMLDIKKKYILAVFPDQKSAADNRELKTVAGIQNSIKKQRLCAGHYFCHYSKLSEEMKNEFLKHNKLPEINRRHNSITVKQIHPITNEIIKEYTSYTEVQRLFKISLKKIKDTIEDKSIYNGYKWSN